MSDEEERGGRWADMSDSCADREESVRVSPEEEAPEPDGRTGFPGMVPPPRPPVQGSPEADDVKVAPVSRSFEEEALFDGEGDPQYAGVTPMAPSAPPKPGKPSSGNWQMPEWMAGESAADAKLGGSGDRFDEGAGRSRLVLFGGIGLLVVALLAAGGGYLLKNRGGQDEGGANGSGKPATEPPPMPQSAPMPPDKPLKRFAGRPTKLVGMVTDDQSGLLYPRLAKPWQPPTKGNRLSTPGWSGQQVLITERSSTRTWYGQLLTGSLNPALHGTYKGPESIPAVTALAAKTIEAQYYDFQHRSVPYASQSLTVSGHKGWLIASYLTYRRAGVRADGELIVTAVIDTGRPVPAVAFAAVPNTHRALYPDVNQFITRLKVVPAGNG